MTPSLVFFLRYIHRFEQRLLLVLGDNFFVHWTYVMISVLKNRGGAPVGEVDISRLLELGLWDIYIYIYVYDYVYLYIYIYI